MQPQSTELYRDAMSIWQAGVEAVNAEQVSYRALAWDDPCLVIDDQEIELQRDSKIFVVGAGKAGEGMAKGVFRALQAAGLANRVQGWLNVPGDAAQFTDAKEPIDSERIHLHAARPLGSNLPTEQAVYGTQRILALVRSARPHDVVLCLLSGGGSSLLVDPVPGISLAQKIRITQALSHAGANIHQLNCVRRALSAVKNGGLLKACAAKQIATLVISDVLDDDLATIASGPTYQQSSFSRLDAIQVLRDFFGQSDPMVEQIIAALEYSHSCNPSAEASVTLKQHVISILANNATAVDAAGVKAVELGYRYLMLCHRECEGDAALVGRQMSRNIHALLTNPSVDCEIFGGEPTVDMSSLTARGRSPGRGGRNQHLVLSAALQLLEDGVDLEPAYEFCLLSGGTDGEDGTTPAAGAWLDHHSLCKLRSIRGMAAEAFDRFDAYSIFERLNLLIDCGLTGTNVCDLRVALVRKKLG